MRLKHCPIVASVVSLAVVSLFFAAPVLAQTDPAVGTWKLNVEKSKYNPGPLPKNNVITIVAVGNGVKVTAKGMDAKGAPTSIEYTATYDGKDVPVKSAPAYDTTSLKRINASTTEQTRKKEGKTVQTVKREISADGKTMTVTTRGKDENGRTINNVAVLIARSHALPIVTSVPSATNCFRCSSPVSPMPPRYSGRIALASKPSTMSRAFWSAMMIASNFWRSLPARTSAL